MSALEWMAAYLAIVLGAGAAAAARSEPTLYRGRTFLRFNGAFAAASLGVGLYWGRAFLPSLGLCDGVLLLTSVATRRVWLVFRADPNGVREVFERSLTMIRASFEASPGGYTVRLGGAILDIDIRGVLRSCAVVTFRGPRGHKKAGLLESLVAKQYRGVVPRLRIRMR